MSLAHLTLLFACNLCIVEADISAKEVAVVSPPLDTTSGKTFDKDYPSDKRPKVDVFHFRHPYPVVQDSDDFDRDFVKDENSDNGSYKAQTEYDRLRHKLQKEKADLAKALKAKEMAEKELEDAMKREKGQHEKVQHMKEDKEKAERQEEEKKKPEKQGSISGNKGQVEHQVPVKNVAPVVKSPGGVSASGAVKVAAGDLQEAMDALEECKKQLADARAKLDKLLKELEAAKKKQEETQAALDAAIKRLKGLEAGQAAVDKKAANEHEEYKESRQAYEKQKAKVAKMEADIKVAAAKVKALRDAEDKNGGVYPTSEKSTSHGTFLPLVALMLMSAVVSLID